MADAIERALEPALTGSCRIGQILIRKSTDGFTLVHRDEKHRRDLPLSGSAEDAIEIARFDDSGNYRPLKTAPNLRHGWRLELVDLDEVQLALGYFYPGRVAMFVA